jgi:hypothetical protein
MYTHCQLEHLSVAMLKTIHILIFNCGLLTIGLIVRCQLPTHLTKIPQAAESPLVNPTHR